MRRQRRRRQVHYTYRGERNRQWARSLQGRQLRALKRALSYPKVARAVATLQGFEALRADTTLQAFEMLQIEDLSIKNWPVTRYDDAAMNLSIMKPGTNPLPPPPVPGTDPIL